MIKPSEMPRRKPTTENQEVESKIQVARRLDFYGKETDEVKIRDKYRPSTTIVVSEKAFTDFIMLAKEGAYDHLIDEEGYL